MPFLCAPPDSPFDTLCPHSISALKGLDFWGVYREGLYAKSPPYPLLSLKIPPPSCGECQGPDWLFRLSTKVKTGWQRWGRSRPPPRLPLGADTAVISAPPLPPPPPRLALPSCVKTPAGFACWPRPGTPGPRAVTSVWPWQGWVWSVGSGSMRPMAPVAREQASVPCLVEPWASSLSGSGLREGCLRGFGQCEVMGAPL